MAAVLRHASEPSSSPILAERSSAMARKRPTTRSRRAQQEDAERPGQSSQVQVAAARPPAANNRFERPIANTDVIEISSDEDDEHSIPLKKSTSPKKPLNGHGRARPAAVSSDDDFQVLETKFNASDRIRTNDRGHAKRNGKGKAKDRDVNGRSDNDHRLEEHSEKKLKDNNDYGKGKGKAVRAEVVEEAINREDKGKEKAHDAQWDEDELPTDKDDERMDLALAHLLSVFPDLDPWEGKAWLRSQAGEDDVPVTECVHRTIDRILQIEDPEMGGYKRANNSHDAVASGSQARISGSGATADSSIYASLASEADPADFDTGGQAVQSAKGKQRQRDDGDSSEEADDDNARAAKRARLVEIQDLSTLKLSDQGSGYECPICCEENIAFCDLIQCPGPECHMFCRECCRRQAEGLLGVRKAELKCMAFEGCDYFFSQREIKRFLPEKSFELYEKIKQEQEIGQAGIATLESCPFCPYSVDMGDVPDEALFICEMEGCRKVSCRFCKDPDHRPKTCAEHAHSKINDPTHKATEALSAALMRFCPKCKAAIVKDITEHGCNKMICRCGRAMCYVCRKDITDEGYKHFDQAPDAYHLPKDIAKCPLWEDTKARHQRELAEARKKHKEHAPPPDPDEAGPSRNPILAAANAFMGAAAPRPAAVPAAAGPFRPGHAYIAQQPGPGRLPAFQFGLPNLQGIGARINRFLGQEDPPAALVPDQGWVPGPVRAPAVPRPVPHAHEPIDWGQGQGEEEWLRQLARREAAVLARSAQARERKLSRSRKNGARKADRPRKTSRAAEEIPVAGPSRTRAAARAAEARDAEAVQPRSAKAANPKDAKVAKPSKLEKARVGAGDQHQDANGKGDQKRRRAEDSDPSTDTDSASETADTESEDERRARKRGRPSQVAGRSDRAQRAYQRAKRK